MKNPLRSKWIPPVVLGAGGIGILLQLWLRSGIDSKGLLIPSHPANIASFLLTAVVVAYLFLCLRAVTGKPSYRAMFPASATSAVGCWIAAAGIGYTVISELPADGNTMSLLCTVLGIAAVVGLLAVGYCRLKGLRPNPIFHTLVTGYLMLHLVCQYRLWNSETQISVLFFRLMASVCLMLGTYHLATLDANMGNLKAFLFFRYSALYLCCLSARGESPVFYTSMALWCILSGCSFSGFESKRAMHLPEPVGQCLDALEKAGFDAYVVGGCVRDSLLGLKPQDYDMCTDATPEQIAQTFSGYQLVRSGEKHGTIGVVIDGAVYEITTFRTEGGYSDSRHPDWVHFEKDVRADLARRDFTVNAMAYSPSKGYIDPFGGQKDLKEKVLRTVGDPAERFTEDALRILRGVRFAARYRLTPHPETEDAMTRLAAHMDKLAQERIFAELSKLLLCAEKEDLIRYAPVITRVIPELAATVDFQQHSPHHTSDVYTHTAQVVAAVPRTLPLRLAALLHDIGKPATFTQDEQGQGHFYAHAQESARIAEGILQRLRVPNTLRAQVLFLIEQHMLLPEADKKILRRRISKYGQENMTMLLKLQRADFASTGTASQEAVFDQLEDMMQQILHENACLRVQDLAVDGNDLIALGFAAGPELGQVLARLLDLVLDEKLANEKDALLGAAKTMKEETP